MLVYDRCIEYFSHKKSTLDRFPLTFEFLSLKCFFKTWTLLEKCNPLWTRYIYLYLTNFKRH